MKRGTPSHPKTHTLAVLLDIQRWGAVGLLESVWHFAQQYALDGNIGRFADEAIARAIGWEGDASKLLAALVQAGWLDRCSCHRLRVHDWPAHADQTVNRTLKTRAQAFLDCYANPSSLLVSAELPLPCRAVAVPSLALPVSESVSVNGGNGAPTYPLPPDEATRTAIRGERWKHESELYKAVGEIAKRTGKEPGEVMAQVTAYKRGDGSIAPGRKRPELLRSDEAVEKSLADARAWLAQLEAKATA